jgi:hypothetical protein
MPLNNHGAPKSTHCPAMQQRTETLNNWGLAMQDVYMRMCVCVLRWRWWWGVLASRASRSLKTANYVPSLSG